MSENLQKINMLYQGESGSRVHPSGCSHFSMRANEKLSKKRQLKIKQKYFINIMLCWCWSPKFKYFPKWVVHPMFFFPKVWELLQYTTLLSLQLIC